MGGRVSLDTWHMHRSNWSQSELTLFRNAMRSLGSQGLLLTMEFGDTDEHEPWLVFCDSGGEVIAHFARLDGHYIACFPFFDETAVTAPELSALLSNVLRRVPRGRKCKNRRRAQAMLRKSFRS